MVKVIVGAIASAAMVTGATAGTLVVQNSVQEVPGNRIEGQVVRVIDGDTVDVQQGWFRHRVRLACIDTPEMGHKPYGQQAKDKLTEVIGKSVIVDVTDPSDRYGRRVGEIFATNPLGETYNVNLRMVREGYAFVYIPYLDNCERNRNEYLDSAVTAKDKKAGFNAIESFSMPWDWRAERKNTGD